MEQRKLYPKLFEAVLSLVGGQLTGGEVLSEFEYHDGQTPPSQAEADAAAAAQAEADAAAAAQAEADAAAA